MVDRGLNFYFPVAEKPYRYFINIVMFATATKMPEVMAQNISM